MKCDATTLTLYFAPCLGSSTCLKTFNLSLVTCVVFVILGDTIRPPKLVSNKNEWSVKPPS